VTPVRSVNGHLDVWIDVFVHDLVPHCVLWAGQLLSRNNSHFQMMLLVVMDLLLIELAGIISLAESFRFEDVASSSIPLEHCMIYHIPQIECLPVNSNQLRTSCPISMRQIVRRAHSCAFRVYSDQVRLVVLD